MSVPTILPPLFTTPLVRRLLDALEAKDPYTVRHSRNVAGYGRCIAAVMDWSPRDRELMYLAGHVHDVGKLGVQTSTLHYPGRLDERQWEEMRAHAELSAVLLDDAVPEQILPWVVAHHERMDGRGYPTGLSGEDIPLGARILAVADSLDAMTAARSYRQAMSFDDAMDELVCCSGTQFDTDVVAAAVDAYHDGALIPGVDRRAQLPTWLAPLAQVA